MTAAAPYRNEFNEADLTGLMNSSLIIERNGNEIVDSTISSLVNRTYNDVNYCKLDQLFVLLEKVPNQIKLHTAEGVWNKNIRIKMEAIGFFTY